MSTPASGGERPAAVLAAAFAAALMIAQQVAGKATRDALFLDHYGAVELPKVMIASAALSMIGVLLTSTGMQRFGPGQLAPFAFGASGALFAAEWALLPVNPGLASWAIYLHMAVFGGITISGFWSVVNERFDPHAARKAVARIGAAATFGGLIGGLGAERVAVLLEPRAMLLILAASNVAAAAAVRRVSGPLRRPPRRSEADATVEPGAGFRILRDVPYLQKLAAMVALVAMTAALLDFALKAEAAARLESGETLMQFFALFYTATSLLTFVVQSLLAKPALSRFGLDGTIALLPALVLVTGVVATAVTRMWTVVLVRGVEAIMANSLFRSGYELLYTPLSPRQKRPTKTIIDVAFDRMGDAIGGAVVLVVLWLAADMAVQVVIGVAVLFATAALVVSRTLQHGYVDALAESLRTGAVRLEDADILDATTRRTLSETTMALDRERLLAEVAALRLARGEDEELSLSPRSDPNRAPPPPSLELVRQLEALASGDRAQLRDVLGRAPDLRLVPLVIDLLDHPELHRHAQDALIRIAPRAVGQLSDALLDPDRSSAVRRRSARVLARCDSPRAVRALVDGLEDERFEVRYTCARALAEIVHRDPALAPPQDRILEAARRELEVGTSAWESQRLLEEEHDETSHWLDEVLRARLHRSLEHVFTVLSLTLDREPLLLSLKALCSADQGLRGTAMEYLENVLPEDLYRSILPVLDQRVRIETAARRSRQQIVEDLLRSMDVVPVDGILLGARTPRDPDAG